jgi:hypothetical protein
MAALARFALAPLRTSVRTITVARTAFPATGAPSQGAFSHRETEIKVQAAAKQVRQICLQILLSLQLFSFHAI